MLLLLAAAKGILREERGRREGRRTGKVVNMQDSCVVCDKFHRTLVSLVVRPISCAEKFPSSYVIDTFPSLVKALHLGARKILGNNCRSARFRDLTLSLGSMGGAPLQQENRWLRRRQRTNNNSTSHSNKTRLVADFKALFW